MANAGLPHSWAHTVNSTHNLPTLAAEVCVKLGQWRRALSTPNMPAAAETSRKAGPRCLPPCACNATCICGVGLLLLTCCLVQFARLPRKGPLPRRARQAGRGRGGVRVCG